MAKKVQSGVRRTLVQSSKGLTVTTTSVHSALRGKKHRHFCSDRECRLYYQDACDQPETNQLCPACRGIRRGYDGWMDPQECCIDNTKQVVDKAVMKLYELAGPGPWYQCQTCFRTHGWPCATTI